MAIIYSYPKITPTLNDLLLISDTSEDGNPTKVATVSSILALGSGGSGGSGSVTNFSVVSTAFPGINTVVTNPTTTPELTLSIVGSPGATQYLDGTGNWSTPSGSGGTVQTISTSAPITGGPITNTGTIGITQSGAAADGYLSSVDWNTFNNKQDALTLTTTGTTGAATLVGSTLNIPIYTGGGGGSVVSVGLSMPSAFSVANSPVTGSDTLAVTGAGTISQFIDGTGALQNISTIPGTFAWSMSDSILTGAIASGDTVTFTGSGGITTSYNSGTKTLSITGSVGGVDSVTTTSSTYINLTPSTPQTGAVDIEANLSAANIGTELNFLRGDNAWASLSAGDGLTTNINATPGSQSTTFAVSYDVIGNTVITAATSFSGTLATNDEILISDTSTGITQRTDLSDLIRLVQNNIGSPDVYFSMDNTGFVNAGNSADTSTAFQGCSFTLAGTGEYKISFGTTLGDTNYMICSTFEPTVLSLLKVNIKEKATSYFIIEIQDTAGAVNVLTNIQLYR